MKKIKPMPIEVSDINSFSDDKGQVLGWHFDVRFKGDLASWHNEKPLPRSLEEFKQYMNWTNADIEQMEDDPVNGGHESIGTKFRKFKQENAGRYKTEVPYILNLEMDIPRRGHISTVTWDEKSKVGDNPYANTLVGYVFLKWWFGYDLWCAKRFRERMLAEMNGYQRG